MHVDLILVRFENVFDCATNPIKTEVDIFRHNLVLVACIVEVIFKWIKQRVKFISDKDGIGIPRR